MDNIQNTISDEDKPKSSGFLKWCLFVFIGIVILMVTGLLAIELLDHIPRIIDTQANDQYIIELKTTSSPDFPFGSQDGRIVLKENKKTISSIDFELRNDGKGMDACNWKVDWKDDRVMVTIIGEEQQDERYCLYYNGDVSDLSSDLS